MDIINLIEIPINFIKENLNGWVILVFICIMIYFIILRNYYTNREKFYDQSMQLKNMRDIEDTEEIIKDQDANEDEDDNNNNNNNNNNNEDDIEKKKENANISKIDIKNKSKKSKKLEEQETIINKKKIKPRKMMGENDTKIVGKKVFEGFHDIKNTEFIEGFEGFISPTTTNFASIKPSSKLPSNTQSNSKIPSITTPTLTINTTIFDNLNINATQINLCKTYYNQIINTYITDLTKLTILQKNNEYLNTKKQFDVIVGRGIDNIINYLSNTIKTKSILTRTSLKTDLMNILSNSLETLINNKNTEITNQTNALAMMNSTTIDYNTMLNNINDSRLQLENYIEIDKLVVNYGKNIKNYNKEVNNILNNSFILPIYERNFDKISQLVKSDFNENETNLANKYGRAYTDFLNEKKKDELDINPLRLASKIESGIVNMLSSVVNSDKNKKSESFQKLTNPIPEQQNNLISSTNLNNNDNPNIYKDRGNLGNYLIDKKTQKQILEGFESSPSTTNPNTTNPNTTDPNITNYEYKKRKSKNNTDIMTSLMSGDFLQYIMEVMNDKIGYLTNIYYNKFNSSDSNNKDNNKFNLEENMIPAGFLLFILSMLIYFVDTTS